MGGAAPGLAVVDATGSLFDRGDGCEIPPLPRPFAWEEHVERLIENKDDISDGDSQRR